MMRFLDDQDIPESGLKTPCGFLYQPLPFDLQIMMVSLTIVGAPFLGKVVGDLIDGLSQSGKLFLYFPYLLTLLLGYLTWMIRLDTLPIKGFISLNSQKEPSNQKEPTKKTPPKRDHEIKMLVKAQRKGISFATISWPFGIINGAVSTLFYSIQGPRSQFIIVSSTIIIWGYFLAYLARRGYLPVIKRG